MDKRCIGIDIGGTTVKLGLFETDGRLVDKWEVDSVMPDGSKNMLPRVAESIRAKLENQEMTLADIIGAGMGVPGPIMPDGYVEVCVNLGWNDINPQRILSGLLDGLPVLSGNDANVAALGEMWQGGGKGYSDIVMVTLGTGVGGGVVIDKKIIAGKHGLGGEIGHIHVREGEKEFCNCGGQGCLEQVASATGIAREARRTMADYDDPSAMREYGELVTAKDVLDCAKAGDKLAERTMETVCKYLGITLAQVSMTVDPEVFVIGGGVSKAGTYLIDKIEKYYSYYTPISKSKAFITLAKLGNDAGIYGGARMILD